ncbi:hypothetical protein ABE61_22850 [Lysinibacillus sphaericus]|uniref:hypothetical protein n=1 Tax=Lysinibacillus sphaericus TaxID=1421 RepID=UPI0018CE0F1E|nr:hypothetical protein [Lysinibacillus sphaericus]MBG9456760.1 hypothetical protein [Lysinibacillus sphaericus]MBG9480184.1 hypothetical protein [Lysinibacillus sphaericus]MBG9594863.1 hypothetical protein [Lysinibacillus sphaericus]
MTSFKDKLDKELGEAPRFSQQLQERILHNVVQQNKQPRRWQYPMIFIGAVMTILFLIVIGPWKQGDSSKQATIIELAQHEVKQFTIAYNWEEDTFKAGRTGWILGQRSYKNDSETKLIANTLQKAVISKKDDDYYAYRDVWVEFGNGQVVQLKMFLNDEQLAFSDRQTNIFYKVQDGDTASSFIALMEKDEKDISFGKMFIFLIVALFLGLFIEIAVRKKFSIPKEPKYLNTGHQRTTYIVKFIEGAILILMNLYGWFIYIAAISGFLVVAMISSIAIDYYYGREEKRHFISIGLFIMSLVLIIVFITYFS